MNSIGFIDLSMLATQPAVTPATTPKTNDGSKFANISSSIANIFSSAAPVISAIKTSGGVAPGAPAYNASLPQSSAFNTQSSSPTPAKNNTVKYVLIAAAALGGTFLVYKIATKKKKSLSGVGDPSDSFALSGAKKKRTRKRKK